MRDSERFRLRFGPYRTPRFRYGATVKDLRVGKVKIAGISDARIPWPYRKKGMPKTLILYGDLAKAVRRESNQAVAYWWGVTRQTVTVWRKALGVPPTTAGTSKLRSAHFHEPWAKLAQQKARAKVRDPERRAKIAAAKLGKPRPAHVIEAMRKANLGKRHSAETRRKMSEAHKRRGTRPPAAGRSWTAEEDALIGERSGEAHRADCLCGEQPTTKARVARWANAGSPPAARISQSSCGLFSDSEPRSRAGPSNCQTTSADVTEGTWQLAAFRVGREPRRSQPKCQSAVGR
jgi:hypothetical protein